MIIKYRRNGRIYWKVGYLLIPTVEAAVELAFGDLS
jgi:hypothetical protein